MYSCIDDMKEDLNIFDKVKKKDFLKRCQHLKRNLSTHIFEHLYFVWGRGNTKLKKCYLSGEHQVLFLGMPPANC